MSFIISILSKIGIWLAPILLEFARKQAVAETNKYLEKVKENKDAGEIDEINVAKAKVAKTRAEKIAASQDLLSLRDKRP